MENQTSDQKRNDVLLIGSGFNIVGDITGHGMCVVDGSIKGSVAAADVKVNSGANISGDLKCTRLDVNGYITGIIEAQDVVLREHARVDGRLSYAKMSMEAGAQIEGEVHLLKNNPVSTESNWVTLAIPEDIASQVAAGRENKLSLPDGTPPPQWVTLSGNALQIDRDLMKQLHKGGESHLVLMLTVDETPFLLHVNLPM